MKIDDDPVQFVASALDVIAHPSQATPADLERLTAIARGLRRRIDRTGEHMAALHADALALRAELARCQEARDLLAPTLAAVLAARGHHGLAAGITTTTTTSKEDQ